MDKREKKTKNEIVNYERYFIRTYKETGPKFPNCTKFNPHNGPHMSDQHHISRAMRPCALGRSWAIKYLEFH